MTVKDLIKELEKQDPDKMVMIQQGEEFPYMLAYTVKEMTLLETDGEEDDDEYDAVVIEYT